MSPAARKFEHALNLPTISDEFLSVEISDISLSTKKPYYGLTIAHRVTDSSSLLKDWMEFTHILGKGILAEIS